MSQETIYVTVGDTLRPLRYQLTDADGRPIDLSGDSSVTFSMATVKGGTAKVSAASATIKQVGDGVTPITAITAADPPVVTSASHGLSTGDIVLIDGVNMLGMDELKGRQFQVTAVDTNSFSLDGENATQHRPYVSGGNVVTRGFVQYSWASGDVNTAGSYYGQFKRTSTSKTEHIPIANAFRIEIVSAVV